MADFTDILSKKSSEVEKPKPKPPGNYLAAIQGMPSQREAKDNKILEFNIKLMAAKEDVDADRLADHPEVSSWPPLKHSVFVNEPWPLKKFLTEVLEIDPGEEGTPSEKTLGQMVAEAAGRQLIVTVANEPYVTSAGEPDIATRIKACAKA